MPRANRHFLPGHVWHMTHLNSSQFQSFQKPALSSIEGFNRFAPFKRFEKNKRTSIGTRKHRRRYLHWLFEAKKRFGLSVLNYMITSNHVHLLIKDTGPNVIADSMQLIAGRTAQEYNQRKDRQGAFWEDRYHATAIEADEHLHRCLIYIDLNMVRAIEY
jgi:REP element-mobilizing transposase RayT